MKAINIFDKTFKGRVIVHYSPVSERMWNEGDEALVENGQIRMGGNWFPFDNRYKVTVKQVIGFHYENEECRAVGLISCCNSCDRVLYSDETLYDGGYCKECNDEINN